MQYQNRFEDGGTYIDEFTSSKEYYSTYKMIKIPSISKGNDGITNIALSRHVKW